MVVVGGVESGPKQQEKLSLFHYPIYPFIQVVAWDLDTTGRKLVDEICHIGGYCPSFSSSSSPTFSQYVMPHRNPNPGARQAVTQFST